MLYYTFIRDDADEASTPVGANCKYSKDYVVIAGSTLGILVITSVHIIGKCVK